MLDLAESDINGNRSALSCRGSPPRHWKMEAIKSYIGPVLTGGWLRSAVKRILTGSTDYKRMSLLTEIGSPSTNHAGAFMPWLPPKQEDL